MKHKVCILIDTGIIGGPGRGILQLLKWADSENFEPTLCTFAYRNPKSTEFIEAVSAHGVPIWTIPQSYSFDIRAVFRIAAVIKERGCSIIQTHGYKTHIIGLLLSKILKISWVAFAHGWTKEDWKVQVYHGIDAFTLRYPQTLIAVSDPLYVVLSELRKGKSTHLILNAVDPEDLSGNLGRSEIRRQLSIPDTTFLIGCFGRLSREKGQQYLLEALARLSRDYRKNIHLLFLGNGPDELLLQELASSLNISQNTTFLSHQSNIRDYYEAIDLLALPSLSEGLPNVVLEAMSLQKPVIASDVGSVGKIISSGKNGILVPPGDVEALQKHLLEFFHEPHKRRLLGIEGQQEVLENFSPKVRVEKIMKVYEALL